MKIPRHADELAGFLSKKWSRLKKFFNTSGLKYRELGLKDKINSASNDELLDLLASDGMLIKRPIITDGEKVTVGFKEEEFAENVVIALQAIMVNRFYSMIDFLVKLMEGLFHECTKRFTLF